MESRVLKANLLMLVAALVWGATFTAQKMAMSTLPPVAYSGLRFLLGALFLLPLAFVRFRRGYAVTPGAGGRWLPVYGAVAAGIFMFFGINLQQIGIVTTTAGKAGFITGLYVVIVPVIGRIFGQRSGFWPWMGVLLGATGLYFLSVGRSFELAPGDGWVLLCAFAWAGHVMVVGYFSPRLDSFVLAFGQAIVCAALSLLVSFFMETFTLRAVLATWAPLLFGGVASVGVGFTLQVVGQRDAPPVHAAVILQMETVFAALFGWLILGETMSLRGGFGAGLMLTGALVAQLGILRKRGRNH